MEQLRSGDQIGKDRSHRLKNLFGVFAGGSVVPSVPRLWRR
jgi:hypothetical protein